jgi:hypothetical protein
MKLLRRAEPLDCHHRVTVVHHRQAEAGVHPPSVHDHGAGTALAVVAALFGASELQMLTRHVEQSRPRVEREFLAGTVDGQRHGHKWQRGLARLFRCSAVPLAMAGAARKDAVAAPVPSISRREIPPDRSSAIKRPMLL